MSHWGLLLVEVLVQCVWCEDGEGELDYIFCSCHIIWKIWYWFPQWWRVLWLFSMDHSTIMASEVNESNEDNVIMESMCCDCPWLYNPRVSSVLPRGNGLVSSINSDGDV
ncbi:hypothetical protein GQ457_01G017100 [Hibiscus cannabinus]